MMRQTTLTLGYARIMLSALSAVVFRQWNPWAATCIG